MTTLGLIGAGRIGSQVARLAVNSGYDVDAGPLSESWRIQKNTPGYGPRRNAEERRPAPAPQA
jgi:predicted dinucleotide-binding enzyme